jgi:hypothetical protein
MPTIAELPLVPGRDCGTCSVCCTALTIDDPALQKPQGYRCRNLNSNDRCGIYATRPKTCSDFYCGWRRLKWVRDTLRPDISGVLVGLKYVDAARQHLGVSFTLLRRSALKAEGLAESVSAAVAADVSVDLIVPGPPGYTSGWARINDALKDAVAMKDKPGVLRVLRQARAMGVNGDHKPIVLKHTKGRTIEADNPIE